MTVESLDSLRQRVLRLEWENEQLRGHHTRIHTGCDYQLPCEPSRLLATDASEVSSETSLRASLSARSDLARSDLSILSTTSCTSEQTSLFTAGKRKNDASDGPELKIIRCDPSLLTSEIAAARRNAVAKRKQQRAVEARARRRAAIEAQRNDETNRKALEDWKKGLNELVYATPSARRWSAQMKTSGITYFIDNALYDRRHIGARGNHPLLIGDDASEIDDVIELADHFAGLTFQDGLTVQHSVVRHNWCKFILLSMVAVLSKEPDTDEGKLFEIVQKCFGRRLERVYMQKLQRLAVLLNKLMDGLSIKEGWGTRAYVIPLFWNRTPEKYRDLIRRPAESLEYLKNELSMDKYTNRHYDDNGHIEERVAEEQEDDDDSTEGTLRGIQLFVPRLIFNALKGKLSMAVIAERLGYTHSSEFEPHMPGRKIG